MLMVLVTLAVQGELDVADGHSGVSKIAGGVSKLGPNTP